jgi:hypothetical protein
MRLAWAAGAVASVVAGCSSFPLAGGAEQPGAFVLAPPTTAIQTAAEPPTRAPGTPSNAPDPVVPVEVPVVKPSTASTTGGGGTGGGGPTGGPPTPPSLPDLVAAFVQADPSQVGLGADGWGTVLLPAGTTGAVTISAAGFVSSTLVIDVGDAARIQAVHQRPLDGLPVPQGQATLAGDLGPAGAALVVAYHAPGLAQAASVVADGTGAFSLAVPVAGEADGIVVAYAPGNEAALALAKVHVLEGQVVTVTGLAPVAPVDAIHPPPLPNGLVPGNSGLVLLDGTGATPVRLDLVGFPGTTVPRYDLPGFTLAASFEAERPDHHAGTAVVTTSSGQPGFLPVPDLGGMPDLLVPGQQLAWPAVAGATLYTLRLQRFGDALPIWEGASGSPRVVLPPDLPTGQADMELEVDAWAANEVSIYTVAGLRQLRVPREAATVGGRRSWAIRQGLGT